MPLASWKLKTHLFKKYPDRETLFINKLSGAIINDLFGTPNTEQPFASFAEENRACIDLFRAEELHILLVDREITLPARFLNLVRKLGGAFDLLVH